MAFLVNDHMPRCGCPHIFLSDRGPEFATGVAKGGHKLLGISQENLLARIIQKWYGGKIGSYDVMSDTLIAENQAYCDEVLPHSVAGQKNNVSRGTTST